MKLNFVKQPGGVLVPATDMDAERLKRFKSGDTYEVEIKLHRNPKFHGKVLSFFRFCFAHWKSDREFMDEAGQFDVFRKNLTVLAGFHKEYYKLDGSVRVEAESLSYGAMDQEQFERVYQALIQAAMRHIFGDLEDQQMYNRLAGFF